MNELMDELNDVDNNYSSDEEETAVRRLQKTRNRSLSRSASRSNSPEPANPRYATKQKKTK